MKSFLKLFLSTGIISVLLVAAPAKAQTDEPGIGIKGGLNLTNLYIDDVDDENLGVGVQVGIVGRLPFTSVLSLQPELLYTQKGATAVSDALDQEVAFNLNYLQLPLLFAFNAGDVFNLHLGPYAAYLLNANVKYDGTVDAVTELNADNFNRFDAGLSLGFEIGVRNLSVGARYDYGLIGVGNEGFVSELTGLENAKNNAIQVYLVLGM
ncbi:MAG: porin family protein [Cyclobacteriaceae bacterium]